VGADEGILVISGLWERLGEIRVCCPLYPHAAPLCDQRRRRRDYLTLAVPSVGVAEVKEVVKTASTNRSISGKRTVLFLDEIHRFNKQQQDALLPHVESGLLTLIGATTENPSFALNRALLSRCRVLVLEKLTADDIRAVIQRALHEMQEMREAGREAGRQEAACQHPVDAGSGWGAWQGKVRVEDAAMAALVGLADGDARVALNTLDSGLVAQACQIFLTSQVFLTSAHHLRFRYSGAEPDVCQPACARPRGPAAPLPRAPRARPTSPGSPSSDR